MAPSNPQRPYNHAKRAKTEIHNHCRLMNWVRKLQSEGREYTVVVLDERQETTTRAFLGEIEKMYIKSLREIGHDLTNDNDGGWGGSNGPHSLESIAKMKAGWTPEARARVGAAAKLRGLGKTRSIEARQRQSESIKGVPKSESHKSALSAIRKAAWEAGVYDTPEYRQRMSDIGKTYDQTANREWHTGRKATAAARQKMSEARIGNTNNLGNKASEETRFKQSAAHKARWEKKLAEGYTVSSETGARISATKRRNGAWKRALKLDPTLDYDLWLIDYEKMN